MKIVKFKGGLGNQLFQYALMRYLEIIHQCEDVKGDLAYFKDLVSDTVRRPRIEQFKIKANWATPNDISKVLLFKRFGGPLSLPYKGIVFAEKTLNRKYFFEPDRAHLDLSKITDKEYYDGYWQSWQYIDAIGPTLRDEIVPNFDLSPSTLQSMAQMSSTNSVFIGIRKGDYTESSIAKKRFGSFDKDYYQRGIDYIKSKVENPVFYIFSNDIDWVKKNMVFDENIIYREDEEQTSDVEELLLMASCKHAIMVNSTFHWWGAWLNNNPQKIILAPDVWFANGEPIDIVPNNWIKLRR